MPITADKTSSTSTKYLWFFRYVWYYEGRNGWWQYDDRTCVEIEVAFANKTKSIDVLVAGSVYVIDLENQIQYQRHRQSRKRKIKRDLETANKKGIAGLHANARETTVAPQPSSSSDTSSNTVQQLMNYSAQKNDVSIADETVESVGENLPRQIPVGADLQPNNSTSSNPLSNATPPPDLIRAVSDISGANSRNQTPDLFRFNTYSHSELSQDELME